MVLVQCGFYCAALGGKVLNETWTGRILSKTQLQILKDYQPVVIAVDNDNAGKESLSVIGAILLENGFKVRFVRPPEGFKDWNALLEKYNSEIVQGYINYNERPLLQVNITELIGQKLCS
jgi:DNA primase